MTGRKKNDLFKTASEFRAQASSLRTISAHAINPLSKARILGMALEWDAKADAFDAAS